MFYIGEFEVYDSGGYVIAEPKFGGEGTFGDDFDDAVESAADWLKEVIEDWLIRGVEPPEPTYGHEPEHGGRMVVLGVSHSLSDVDAVTSAKAAELLGVSAARVTQMCDSGLLVSWKDGARRMVTRDSVDARIAEQPKPGRPKKSAVNA